MVNKSAVHALANELFDEVRNMRRHLHTHPELSFQEHETAAYIAACLQDAGISFTSGVGGTGLIAELEGKGDGPLIALRGDMDALPIKEVNEVPYASKNAGVMHACGHDAHTASVFGAMKILHQLRDQWSGKVRIFFQPGEERIPGGASLMIRDGALKPMPDRLFGQHVYPELPAGHVGFKPGMYMASADELYLTVRGKGGHAALVRRFQDPVLAAAEIIVALQQVVSRNAPPEVPTVLSIGKVLAEGATNVIPNEVIIEGTFRTFNEEWRSEAHGLIERIAKHTALAGGVEVEVEVRKGYPFLVNDEGTTLRARDCAIAYLGADRVHELDLRPTAEDFAFFSQQVPSCFYRLGTAAMDGRFTSGLHTPTFDIDEDALRTGSGLMAWLALDALGAAEVSA